MNIDANTPERDVLIAYLENSGVSQQKEAAKEMRKMEAEIEIKRQLIEDWRNASSIGRIVLWFKGK